MAVGAEAEQPARLKRGRPAKEKSTDTPRRGRGRPRKYSEPARKKGEKPIIQQRLYLCYMCDTEKLAKHFFTARKDIVKVGLIPYCKQCLKDYCYYRTADGDLVFSVPRLVEMLQLCNVPWIERIWLDVAAKIEDNQKNERRGKGVKNDFLGDYMQRLSRPQFKGLGFGDLPMGTDISVQSEKVLGAKLTYNDRRNFVVTDEMAAKWGDFDVDTIRRFERKYEELTKANIGKSVLHEEFIVPYIIYSTMSRIAIENDDARSAKEWGDLAAKAAEAAKIMPKQLTKADLSDGLDSVSQIVRAVEQQVDIISVLPKFKGAPQDTIDKTLLQYVNYIRRLKGLPECESYADIWQFSEQIVYSFSEKDTHAQTDKEPGEDGSL